MRIEREKQQKRRFQKTLTLTLRDRGVRDSPGPLRTNSSFSGHPWLRPRAREERGGEETNEPRVPGELELTAVLFGRNGRIAVGSDPTARSGRHHAGPQVGSEPPDLY